MSRRSAIVAWAARHGLLLTLLLALALRLLLWSQPLHQLANDEVEYVTVARDLLHGRGWQFYEHYHWLRAPLYPLFLAGSLWLAGGDLHLAALPNVALSVATVYLSYRLARALAGPRAALPAGLLTALLWTLATFASLYMSETLFTFLFMGALLCLVRAAGWDAGRWKRLVAAGVLFGLATLTRSITLLFLPVAAIWLLVAAVDRSERGGAALTWRSIACTACFAACALGTIAPWTIRNTRAYGRPIPVETGLSYNLWAFNEPREDPDTIFRTLESIPNPADRSDYATAKGMARLREDPAILLRKLWPNWLSLWRVKPIEDRFIQESYYADVGLPLFAAALLFDDALYLLILLAAIAGLVFLGRSTDDRPSTTDPETRRQGDKETRGQGDKETRGQGDKETRRYIGPLPLSPQSSALSPGPKWLIVAWILYVVATVLLTHGEGRYRHFLFPVLIPYAAWALVRLADHRPRLGRASRGAAPQPPRSPYQLVVAALWALPLGTVLVFYPWSWAGQDVARGWQTLLGDVTWASGSPAAALSAYERALVVHETPDAWLRLGDAARAAGDLQRARAAYRVAVALGPSYAAAIVRYGDLLRELGDEAAARTAFIGSYADAQQIADRAWRDLRPIPRARLDIGDGLDFGYVGGVYPAEELQGATARWTGGHGLLRLRGAAETGLVSLRLAAPRPGGSATQARVCAAGRCWPLNVGPRWRTYVVPFDGASGATLLVEVYSDTFDAPDGRRLGVLIDTASVAGLQR